MLKTLYRALSIVGFEAFILAVTLLVGYCIANVIGSLQ